MTNQTHTTQDEMTIRMLGAADAAAVATLAERDSAPLPQLPLLGAELGGKLIAAMPLTGSREQAIADPFSSSADAVALLETRVRQLHGGSRRRLRLGALVPRNRGTLPSSPPGAGGRLLRL